VSVPLHVTLSSFNASPTADESVSINWTTESEANIRGFNVYRSDSRDFSSATIVNTSIITAHNTAVSQTYALEDKEVIVGNEYFYWLVAHSHDSTTQTFEPVQVRVVFENNAVVIPMITALSSVFPNPVSVNDMSKFDITVKENETATLRIFNVRGQLVREFDALRTGEHQVRWDHKDSNNREVATGIYFYQLQSPSTHVIQRMTVIK